MSGVKLINLAYFLHYLLFFLIFPKFLVQTKSLGLYFDQEFVEGNEKVSLCLDQGFGKEKGK